jgi:hypothetical protein
VVLGDHDHIVGAGTLERLRPVVGVEVGDLPLKDLLEALVGHVAAGVAVVVGRR